MSDEGCTHGRTGPADCKYCRRAIEERAESIQRSLNGKANEMATMLRRLEWTGGIPSVKRGVTVCCPVCYSTNVGLRGAIGEGYNGVHAPTCDLATLLRELP